MADKVTLEILFEPSTGNIAVNGPIHNKVLCYGILEAAKAAIKDFEGEKPGAIVLPPTRFQVPPNGR